MITFALGRSDVQVMLWHMALYGLGAILEDAGVSDIRLSWTTGMEPRARVQAPDLSEQAVDEIVREHAAQRSTELSWLSRDLALNGKARGLMSPRVGAIGNDPAAWAALQEARASVLDDLTDSRSGLDLRLLAALGEPCYWSRSRQGDAQQDDGASRLEMQPRNQGSEFVGSRLRKLASSVASRAGGVVADGLAGSHLQDEIGGGKVDSRTATGFANAGPTDNAVAWCALWGISQLPLAVRIDRTALTAGHIGRIRQEWFYLPYWTAAWRPAQLRSVLVSQHLRSAATVGLPAPWAVDHVQVLVAQSWLQSRGVHGLVRFRIERFGSDSAPERRAMRGEPVRWRSS